MNDYIEDMLSELDEYYPNSKRKRRPVVAVSKKDEPLSWDAKPTEKTLPNGVKLELYTINALATALNRPLPTLRLWMQEGNLPASPYRLPTKLDKNGKEKPGRRLYSRQMIEAAVDIFDRAGLLHTDRVHWSDNRQVTLDISEAWAKIRAEETTTV